MRHRMAIAATVLLLLLVLPAVCLAGDVGKVTGKVVDSSTGEPLNLANVVIVGTNLGAMAGEDGSFLILNVAPGKYDIQASYIGYRTVVVSGLIVEPDLTRTVVFQLDQSALESVEPVLVRAQRPLVQVDVTSTRNIFLAEEITSLPTDNPVNVINYISGSAIDAGGTHIRGGRVQEVGYYIDDAPIQDPIANDAMLSVSNQTVNEMVVFTGGFNAEYGNASSGIVNIITSEGSDKFEGSVEHRMYLPVDNLWIRSDSGDPLKTGESKQRLTVSGPLYKTKESDLRYALALEATRWDDWDPHVEVLNRPGKARLFDGALTLRAGKTTLKAVGNVELDRHISSFDAYRLYERILVPDTWRWTENNNYRIAFSASRMLTAKSYLRGTFSMLDGWLEIAQRDRKWDPNLTYEENQTKYHWDLDERRDENNFVISGDNPYYDLQKKRVYSFRGNYTNQIGRNEVKAGLDFSTYHVKNDDIFASTQNYYIYTYDVKPSSGAMYLQDKIEFEGLIMNLGARFDFFDPNHTRFNDYNHPYDLSAPESLWHGPDGDEAPIERARYDSTGAYLGGGLVDADVKWKLSPRLGASYPITPVSYLHMQYGHFFQMPSFNYLYTNEKFHTRGRWLLVGNPDLEAEKTVAYEVGVNHLLSTNTAIDFTFFYKDITDMVETVTRGPSAESNPQSTNNYVTYMNTGYGNVRGFEINLKRRHFNNWHYHGAYTFMVARGFSSNVNEGYLRRFDNEDFPTQQFYLDWDRRHSFLLTLGYSMPDNWGVEAVGTYATGTPYTDPKVLSRKPAKNGARFDSISNVDLEVHKFFRVFDLNTDVFIRMTNLFDQRNILNWDDTDQDFRNWLLSHPGDFLGPFHDYTVYGQPRNVVGGVKIRF